MNSLIESEISPTKGTEVMTGFKRVIKNAELCPHCGGNDLRVLESNGSLMCVNCMQEIKGHCIDYTADWNCYADASDRADPAHASRVGGLDEEEVDVGIDPLPGQRFKGYSTWTDRSQYEANQWITFWGRILSIKGNVCEIAQETYDKLTSSESFKSQNGFKGRNRKHIAAALLIRICKANNQDLTPREMNEATGVAVGDLIKSITFINKMLKGTTAPPKIMTAPDYIRGFCDKLGLYSLKQRSERICRTVIDKNKLNIEGKKPKTIAAAVLLLISRAINSPIKMSEIARVAECGEPTIQKCYSEIISPKSGLSGCFPGDKEITEYIGKGKN